MTGVKKHVSSKGMDPSPTALPRKPGVLVADDMGLILTMLKVALEARGFDVWLAMDGDDAIDQYKRDSAEIDLVLLDVQMPGLDGPRTLNALRRLDPDILACFMTGDAGSYTRSDLMACGAVCVFDKPFVAAELAHALCATLAIHEVRQSASLVNTADGSSPLRRTRDAITETH